MLVIPVLPGATMPPVITSFTASSTGIASGNVSDTFTIEPELTAKAARRGARFVEVAISYQGRGYEAGKKIDWRDGVRALFAIARFGWGARGGSRRG